MREKAKATTWEQHGHKGSNSFTPSHKDTVLKEQTKLRCLKRTTLKLLLLTKQQKSVVFCVFIYSLLKAFHRFIHRKAGRGLGRASGPALGAKQER